MVDLIQGYELIWFMGLGDVAGAADDAGDLGAFLEQSGLGAKGHLDVVVAPGQRLDESHHVFIGVNCVVTRDIPSSSKVTNPGGIEVQ